MRSRHFLVSVFACLLGSVSGSGCGGTDASGTSPTSTRTPAPSAAAISSEGAASTSPSVPAGDHEGVPAYGPAAPMCSPATGDARAMRTALRTLARERSAVPPPLDAFLVGCVASRAEVANAYKQAGVAFTRRREHAIAALYYRRALEADASSLEARFALVRARASLGDHGGALYQLEVLRNAGPAGDRYVVRAMRDGALASLRLRREFWTWAHDPVPDAVTLLAANAPETAVPSALASMSFTPAIGTDPMAIFERVRFERPHYGVILDGVHDALDGYLRSMRSATSADFTEFDVAGLARMSVTTVSTPSLYRLTETESVLAIPFYGELEGTPELVGIIAVGPSEGPYQIVQIVTPSSGCATPALIASRDRRAVGWLTSCTAEDPSAFGRCLLHADGGRITMRCGGSETGGALGDSGDEEYGDDEDYEAYED